MEENSVLKISGLNKRYGGLQALNDLNLNVQNGTIYGLLGPNGSGKTTTLSIALGVLKQTSGDYFWFGAPPSPKSRLRIGGLIEEPNFYPYMSLCDNLRIVAKIRGVPENQINHVLGITNLLKRKYSKFKNLSSGLKQRLALASALLGDPDVLVLDEPTKSLDPEGFSDLRKIIQDEAQKGKTIILASHILDEVEKVCTHVGILKSGKLIREGKVSEILGSGEIYYIKSENREKLERILESSEIVKNFEEINDDFKVILKENNTSADLNKHIFDQGAVLTKLEVKKNTLEKEFLELIK